MPDFSAFSKLKCAYKVVAVNALFVKCKITVFYAYFYMLPNCSADFATEIYCLYVLVKVNSLIFVILQRFFVSSPHNALL